MKILRRASGVFLTMLFMCCILAAPAWAAYNTVPSKPFPKLDIVSILSGAAVDAKIELKFTNNVAAISEIQDNRPDMIGINEQNPTKFSMKEAESGNPVSITVERHQGAVMHSDESKYFYVLAEGLDVNKQYIITVAEDFYANMGNSLGAPYEVTFCIAKQEISFAPVGDLPSVDIVQPLFFSKANIETNATEVAVDTTFSMTFSHNVSGAAVLAYNSAYIGLFKGTNQVEAEILPGENDDVKTLIIKPKNHLEAGTEYQIAVKKELMAKNGEKLSSPVKLYFTTKKAAEGGGAGGAGGGSGGKPVPPVDPTKPIDPAKPTDPTKPSKTYFGDVANSWAANDINALAEKAIVSGNPDGNFLPDASMTRAEAVTMLTRAFKITGGTGTTAFKDIENHWAKSAIMAAEAGGFASGVGAAIFDPDASITREEFAVMLVRISKLTSKGTPINFADGAKISPWAVDCVAIASGNGIIGGYADSTFGPANKVTRAEACRMINNLLKLQATNVDKIEKPKAA